LKKYEIDEELSNKVKQSVKKQEKIIKNLMEIEPEDRLSRSFEAFKK